MIVSRKHTPAYSWGEKCSGWHLVRNESLSVIEEEMPPGAAEIEHFHEQAQQFFYVLVGELSIVLEDEVVTLTIGEGRSIACGVRHQAKNLGKVACRFLVTSTPPSQGDRVELP